MSSHPLPEEFHGNLEELAEQANQLLPQFLPETTRQGRVNDLVNPRLIRHYTTQGLLDEPLKAGREARYTTRHLLQLLALRKLMVDGLSAGGTHDLLRGKSDHELRALLSGTTRLGVTPAAPSNPALAYLHELSHSSPPHSPTAPQRSVTRDSTSPGAPRPERWTRIHVEHGLELNIRDDYRPPKSPAERERLARALSELLAQLQRK